MKTYTIVRTDKPPVWSEIPPLAIDARRKTPVTDVTASAQLCYDEAALYLHLATREADILAVQNGVLGQPSEDSCLEFFFSPMQGDLRYLNFEWNLNGCLFLGFSRDSSTLLRILPEEERAEDLFSPSVSRTADGWEIFFRIPAEFVRRFFPDFRLESGKTIRANCYKCGGRKGERHYLTWSPVPDTENFHTPHNFGEMTLE